MDISSSLAAGTNGKIRSIADPGESGGSAISQSIRELGQDFSDTIRQAETAARDTMLGKSDPQSMVEALAQAQLAVETALSVRDKVVEAYQEIMRMQI